MTYEQVSTLSQVAALVFFIALFAGVVIYACWPGNKKAFEEDAKIPLQQDPDHEIDDERDG